MARLNYYANFEIVTVKCDHIVSGWLAPSGVFDECGWGEHTDLAYDILKQNDWYKDYRKDKFYHTEDVRDFLVRRKFYILFDNPCADEETQKIIFNPFVRRTKVQTNKMFNLIKHSDELTNIMLQKLSEVK